MKTKRISISIILVFVIIVTLFAGIYVSAESAYDELLEQSKLDPNWGNSPVDDFRVYYPLRPGWGCLAVLLYTDVAKDLTFEVQTSDGEEFEVFYPHETMFVFRDSTIISPE